MAVRHLSLSIPHIELEICRRDWQQSLPLLMAGGDSCTASSLQVTEEEAEWLFGIPGDDALEHPEKVGFSAACNDAGCCAVEPWLYWYICKRPSRRAACSAARSGCCDSKARQAVR